LLQLADQLGPFICVLKTHIDILSDFTIETAEKLVEISKKHDFLIFEDRKFADIGHTVQLQYGGGIYRIAEWSHFTNCHSFPGPGIIEGLKQVGKPLNRGLLLLAEMSSKGCLSTQHYQDETLLMALNHLDFVFGFIGQHRPEIPQHLSLQHQQADFVIMTPGVQLNASGDALGQQYRTPRQVILEHDCDVIIVGRGLYSKGNPIENAKMYQKAGWDAYLEKL
jgi:orotidine-5'-phosphate decarboxylase